MMQQSSASSSSPKQNPNFDSNVISERVKNLATQIYQELKRIISRCNYDEDILSGLMPLIVRVLESLDLALIENQQLQVELELCKDDNEQLVIMFEKEKAAKRAIDNKLIESEYAYEEERQQHQQKIESLDSIVKMYELKAKNASDQAARFEEKEAERKKEYTKLHDRYTELLKSHCDVVERFRHLAGSSEVVNLTSINVPHQMVASSSDLTLTESQPIQLSRSRLKIDEPDFDRAVVGSSAGSRPGEILRSWNAETELTLEDASLVMVEDMGMDSHHKQSSSSSGVGGQTSDGSSQHGSDRATMDPDGDHDKDGENDSIAYMSMEKEFRKLIQENKDLLNTKNALNVVKDDLIAEVDRLTNEVSMYEQAVEQLNATKDEMKQKVSNLDAELRHTKDELEKAKQKIRENNEEGVPYSQRKRFGRAEMAKVLMERNNYKERFMELQDALRYTELVRANRAETEKRSGLWKFFNNLFGSAPRDQLALGAASTSQSRNSSPVVSYYGSPAAMSSDKLVLSNASLAQETGQQSSSRANSSMRPAGQRLSSNSDMMLLMDSDLNMDRNRAIRGKLGPMSSSSDSYIHAYGWSLPASIFKALASGTNANESDGTSVAKAPGSSLEANISAQGGELTVSGSKLPPLMVPIPQYCRPLTGDSMGMKIWCATAIDLSGGSVVETKPSPSTSGRDSWSPTRERVHQNQQQQQQQSANVDSSGSIVNISTSTPIKSPGSRQALKMLEQEVNEALNESTNTMRVHTDPLEANQPPQRPILKTTTEMVLSRLPMADDGEDLSTCVWVCSTQHSRSKITIIDIKTKPNDLLDSFYVPTFLYCLKSVPGCKASDLLGITGHYSATVPNNDSAAVQSSSTGQSEQDKQMERRSITLNMINELIANQKRDFYKLVEVRGDSARSRDPQSANERKSKPKKRVIFKDSTGEDLEQTIGPEEGAQQVAEEFVVGEDEEDIAAEAVAAADAEDDDDDEAEDDADAEISRILDDNVSDGIATLQKLNDFVAHTQPHQSGQTSPRQQSEPTMMMTDDPEQRQQRLSRDSASSNTHDASYYQPISTCLSTVWMGGRDSVLYIHSAIGQWKDCVAYVKLRDSILQICHFRGRVFVALADGTLCVFFRNMDTRQWEFSHYLLIDVNLMADVMNDAVDVSQEDDNSDQLADESAGDTIPGELGDARSQDTSGQRAERSLDNSRASRAMTRSARTKVAGIRCLEIANKNLWVGYKNKVLIIDPISLKLRHAINVIPQQDNQIRQLVSMKDGVFCCLRSDLILRLYSSLKPYQHIQNIDIEPVVTRLISPRTFVISHITAMKVDDQTLWIGNAHGIILTIPCKLVPQISDSPDLSPSSRQENEDAESSGVLSIARFVPKCDIANAQISFHGHKDAVKFFIGAHSLMLSGGQGYLDFRLDMDDQSRSISDKSHVILWQLPK